MDAWVGDVISQLLSLDGATIYAIGFGVLLACGLGLPIPEDITLLLMGYMTYHPMPDGSPRPNAHIVAAVLIGLAGVMIGDAFMFFMGRRFGVKLLDVWPFSRMFGGGRLASAERFLERNGPKMLFSARFMPGLRSVVFFTSGTLSIPYPRFLLYDGLAALISVPALVLAAWHWGDKFDLVVERARRAENGMLLIILGAVAVVLIKHGLEVRSRKAAAARDAATAEKPSLAAQGGEGQSVDGGNDAVEAAARVRTEAGDAP